MHLGKVITDEKQIIILGAGGHGKEVSSYIRDLSARGERIRPVGFVDEHKPRGPWGATEVLGGFDELQSILSRAADSAMLYITAVGNNRLRSEFVRKLEGLNVRNLPAWTLRHPHSVVGHDVEIGEGTCLAPGSIITTSVRIGKHCIVNVNASVSHDSIIGDFTNINPGAVIAGNVRIGQGCYIGAGATVIEKLAIGDWAVIGAGAVVINDIPPRVTAVGVPARVIKQNGAG